MHRFCAALFVIAVACTAAGAAQAGQGMTVMLQPAQGAGVAVADLDLAADGSYTLVFREQPFEPHFLSMRPFQCIPAPPELQCHLPYPYDKSRQLSGDDLGDLEYDLLFLVKQADEFGVDFWNGRYYRLRREGDAIVGEAYAADMNILASKPPAGDQRPIKDSEQSELAPADTPFPRVSIQPSGES